MVYRQRAVNASDAFPHADETIVPGLVAGSQDLVGYPAAIVCEAYVQADFLKIILSVNSSARP